MYTIFKTLTKFDQWQISKCEIIVQHFFYNSIKRKIFLYTKINGIEDIINRLINI